MITTWVVILITALLTFCAIIYVLAYRRGYRAGAGWVVGEWKIINEKIKSEVDKDE